MLIEILLIYLVSYIGSRLIIGFLKEQKMIKDRDDPKIACIVIAPLIFIGFIVSALIFQGASALMACICLLATKKKREDEFVNKYNKKLPEIRYKLNRFLETGKPAYEHKFKNKSTINIRK